MTMNERICTRIVYSDSWWMLVLIIVIFISEHVAQLNVRSKYTSLTRICHALLTHNTRRLLPFIIWFLLYTTTDDKPASISAVRIQYNGFWDWSCQTHAIGEDSDQIRRKHVRDSVANERCGRFCSIHLTRRWYFCFVSSSERQDMDPIFKINVETDLSSHYLDKTYPSAKKSLYLLTIIHPSCRQRENRDNT